MSEVKFSVDPKKGIPPTLEGKIELILWSIKSYQTILQDVDNRELVQRLSEERIIDGVSKAFNVKPEEVDNLLNKFISYLEPELGQDWTDPKIYSRINNNPASAYNLLAFLSDNFGFESYEAYLKANKIYTRLVSALLLTLLIGMLALGSLHVGLPFACGIGIFFVADASNRYKRKILLALRKLIN
ncbi:MAG: hypothetical protein LW875_03980 [Proteobacteria bacterium]|jgi:hypothetical protein|nr:hypothetical protein [Pseudomonadota bacterium]